MWINFERPVGAPADTNELEYVSALLQTNADFLRQDATITARDIRLYLKSRHGLRVPMEKVTDQLLCRLAGTVISDDFRVSLLGLEAEDQPLVAKPKEDQVPKLDLVQFASLLLIPVFREIEEKAKHANRVKERLYRGKSKALTVRPGAADDDDRQDEMEETPNLLNYIMEETVDTVPAPEAALCEHDQEDESSADSCLADSANFDFIEGILSVILMESGYDYGDELTESVLRKLLQSFQEDWPDHVVKAMLHACKKNPKDPSEKVYLTCPTILRALTADVGLYDVKRQTMGSTHYEDAMQSGPGGKKASRESGTLRRFWTAPNIDNAADTYASFSWRVLAWFTLAMTFLAYLFDGITPEQGFPTPNCMNPDTSFDNLGDFGCKIAISVAVWLEIFLKLATLGFAFLFLTTLGNSVYHFSSSRLKGLLLLFVGMLTVIVYCMLSYQYDVKTEFFDTTIDRKNTYQAFLALVLGCALFLVQLVQLIRLLIPHRYFDQVLCCLTPGALRMELNVKLSCKHKVQKMIENALICHSDNEGDEIHRRKRGLTTTKKSLKRSTPAEKQPAQSQGRRALLLSSMQQAMIDLDQEASGMADAVVRYHKKKDDRVMTGGSFWIWKSMFNSTLFREEGCWLFPRLVSSNMVQWVVVLAFLAVSAFGSRAIAMIDLSNFQYVTHSELQFAFLCGAAPAVIGAAATALAYIPSAFCTILKFRSGNLPSLKDRRWLQHRCALDTTNLLFGASFWACVASGAVLWIIVGLLGYSWVATNPDVRKVANTAYATVFGVGITMGIKMVIMYFIRVKWYGAFMRRRPAAVNIANAVEDSWNLGLTTWVIIIRTCKILFCALYYIGRIDTPFLAPGVGWILDKWPLDTLPISFNMDLLIHDAHRHPYIERVGLMYMLKLRHGDAFGRPEGAAWRIIFTQALFPWLRNYRLDDIKNVNADSIHILRRENRKLCLKIKEMEEAMEALRVEAAKAGVILLKQEKALSAASEQDDGKEDKSNKEDKNGNKGSFFCDGFNETTADDNDEEPRWLGVATGLQFSDHPFEVKM